MAPFLHLNGRPVEVNRLNSFEANTEFERSTIDFLRQWNEGKDIFYMHTSGSTGKPAKIGIHKNQMVASAKMTIKAFDLSPNDTLHLCLNTKFIAGKMMLARAMVGKMNIIAEEPAAYPLGISAPCSDIDFTALIPLQLENLLANDLALSSLNRMKGIIIGGAPVSDALEEKLQIVAAPIYATFGMTETVTHIALQRLNGAERSKYYHVLPGVKIRQDDRECLVIKGPVTAGKTIITNDRVKLFDKTHFEWLGRLDNVINSGGIKIQLEEVEREIMKILRKLGIKNRAFAAGIPSQTLGQELVLCLEGTTFSKSSILSELKAQLPKYHTPKDIFFIDRFVETSTRKVNRGETLKLVVKL